MTAATSITLDETVKRWFGRILLAALALVAFGVGELLLGSPRAMPVQGGAMIVLHRQPAHVFLAEYHRQLALLQDGRELRRTAIQMDTGGAATMDAYRLGPEMVLLIDRLSAFTVDLADGSVTTLRRDELVPQGDFIGAFAEVGAERVYRFVPRTERATPSVASARRG